MEFINTKIEGVTIIEPTVYGDERGYFFEAYRESEFSDNGITHPFKQVNCSSSRQGVLRGLHLQTTQPQGKLVSVTAGEVFDVAVDVNPKSPTYGQWEGVILSHENKRMFWIAPGLAHGFYVLSEEAEFHYSCTDYYHPASEKCLAWNDAAVNIQWPLLKNQAPSLSAKDEEGLSLDQLILIT